MRRGCIGRIVQRSTRLFSSFEPPTIQYIDDDSDLEEPGESNEPAASKAPVPTPKQEQWSPIPSAQPAAWGMDRQDAGQQLGRMSSERKGPIDKNRLFTQWNVYKGKSALCFSPIPPSIEQTETGKALTRPGVLLVEAAPAIGPRQYDWKNKIVHHFFIHRA